MVEFRGQIGIAILCVLLGGCAERNSRALTIGGPQPAYAARDENSTLAQTTRIGVDVVGLRFDKIVERGNRANFSGLRSAELMFSRRLDSRTYFEYDRRFSQATKFGVYRASDKEVMRNARNLLAKLDIPSKEIATFKVLQEKDQTGRLDRSTHRIVEGRVTLGKKFAYVTREINGIPVFSSRAVMGFMLNGQPGFLEIHWPIIPEKTIGEAQQLRELVATGWHPPQLQGARVESVAAGIIHSPAAAFAMDIYPAIRVIYVNNNPRFGLKPVRYYNASGGLIRDPRVFLKAPPGGTNRSRPRGKAKTT